MIINVCVAIYDLTESIARSYQQPSWFAKPILRIFHHIRIHSHKIRSLSYCQAAAITQLLEYCTTDTVCDFFTVELQDMESAQLMQCVDNWLAVDKL